MGSEGSKSEGGAASVGSVPAVTRAMALLELLAAEREGMTPSRIAARLQLPKSSVHGLCSTLAARGYLRRQEDGSYFVGPAVMALANAFIGQTTAAQEFASLWHELSAPPEETVVLSVLEGADVIYVGARNGDRPLGLAFTIGMRLPAHMAATGKAMLAWRSEDELRSLYPTGRLPSYRGGTVSLKAFREELTLTRQRGYSIDDEGVREGVYCIGAPVFDPDARACAAIGLCVHKGLLDARAEQRHREAVLRIARLLTQRLGGRAPQCRAQAAAEQRE